MARYRGPVVKRCRALGITPAELGQSKTSTRFTKETKVSRKKASDYSMQLKEKQKVKFIYGVLEKQFRLYYEKASRQRGVTGENMLVMLESRLDNVVYRMSIGKTRGQARQLVNHGLITVNGKRVNIPSYLVKKGDVIAVKDNKKDKKVFEYLKASKSLGLPKWLEFDNETLTGKVVELPKREDIDPSIAEHLIVELYSK